MRVIAVGFVLWIVLELDGCFAQDWRTLVAIKVRFNVRVVIMYYNLSRK